MPEPEELPPVGPLVVDWEVPVNPPRSRRPHRIAGSALNPPPLDRSKPHRKTHKNQRDERFLTDTLETGAQLMQALPFHPTAGSPRLIADDTPDTPDSPATGIVLGGKPRNLAKSKQAAKNLLLRAMTQKLLEHMDVGLSDAGELALRIRSGEPKALEIAARLVEVLHDRAWHRPKVLPTSQVVASLGSEEDGEESRPRRVVAIGAVQIEF
jgi:hypothetical protein